MKRKMTRRGFLAATAVAAVGSGVHGAPSAVEKPALLGGKPLRVGHFPSWPVFDESDEQALLKVLRSGQWFEGSGTTVKRFEEKYAHLMGARFCIATNSGTSSLIT